MKLAAALLVTVLLVAGCGSDDDGGDTITVTGTLIAPDDAPALDDGTVLTVRIEDVSLADAPSVVLAEQETVVNEGDFPFDFELAYDPDEIEATNTYTVSARVMSGDSLVMISDTVTPVISNGAPTADVEVALVAV